MNNTKHNNTLSDLGRDIDAINVFATNIMDKYEMTYDELIIKMSSLKSQTGVTIIPSSIFLDSSLGFMEAIAKYLKENMNLKLVKIAKLLNRSGRSVWITYYKAKKKHPSRLLIKEPNIWVPISVFQNPELGPLRSLSIYLKDKLNMDFIDIARLINRNNKSIWACYNRDSKRVK
jgi:hypothetical protein